MTEEAVIKPWGNSQGIRLSKRILEQAGFHVDDSVIIEIADGAILLKKGFRHKTFEERLEEYDGKITNCDFEWGEPEGDEIF